MPRLRATGALLFCLAIASSRAPRARGRNVTPHAEWEPGYSFAAIGLRDTLFSSCSSTAVDTQAWAERRSTGAA